MSTPPPKYRIPGPAGALQEALRRGKAAEQIEAGAVPVPDDETAHQDPYDPAESPWFKTSSWLELMDALDLKKFDPESPMLRTNVAWILNGGWRGYRVHRLAVIIIDAFESPWGDLKVSLADPTGVIRCTIHKEVLEGYPNAMVVGGSMLLKDVPVLTLAEATEHYLCVTNNELVQVFDRGLKDAEDILRKPEAFGMEPNDDFLDDMDTDDDDEATDDDGDGGDGDGGTRRKTREDSAAERKRREDEARAEFARRVEALTPQSARGRVGGATPDTPESIAARIHSQVEEIEKIQDEREAKHKRRCEARAAENAKKEREGPSPLELLRRLPVEGDAGGEGVGGGGLSAFALAAANILKRKEPEPAAGGGGGGGGGLESPNPSQEPRRSREGGGGTEDGMDAT
jgi:hypothetical protein